MAYLKFRPLANSFDFISTINTGDIPEEITDLLNSDEKVFVAVKTIRDVGIFTNKRILLIDVKGIFGKCRECFSLPYSSISTFNYLTGNFITKIRIMADSGYPITLRFLKSIDKKVATEVYMILSNKVLDK
jgi:hypothetical protein